MRTKEKNRQTFKKYFQKVAKGSRKDESWYMGEHTCCNSKHSHHHRVGCKLNSEDLSDLKDI